jgi:hypothetical protein
VVVYMDEQDRVLGWSLPQLNVGVLESRDVERRPAEPPLPPADA